MVEETIAAINTQPFVSIQPDMPVHSAIEMLVGRDIACALVVDEDRLVGVFSDRDALDKVALEYEQVKDKPVREVMTKNPFFVRDDDSPAAVLCVMAAEGYRHVPVFEKLSFSIPSGTLGAVIGPNGCGKTTLIRAATGLLPHASGRVTLFGQDIRKLSAEGWG